VKACIVQPKATAEIDDHARYIAINNPVAAAEFLDQILDTLRSIRSGATWFAHVDIGRYPGLRRATVGRFKWYKIYFTADDERVVVIRVLHDARDITAQLDQSFSD